MIPFSYVYRKNAPIFSTMRTCIVVMGVAGGVVPVVMTVLVAMMMVVAAAQQPGAGQIHCQTQAGQGDGLVRRCAALRAHSEHEPLRAVQEFARTGRTPCIIFRQGHRGIVGTGHRKRGQPVGFGRDAGCGAG